VIYRNHLQTALFHSVHRQRYGGKYDKVQVADISKDEFRECIKWLSKRFRFLSVSDILKGDSRGLIITIDDGFLNNTNITDVLEEFNAPVVIFVSTQHIVSATDWLWFIKDRYKLIADEDADPAIVSDLFDGLGVQKLVELSRHPLIEIGCHTITHPYLSRISPEEQYKEIVESKQYLESIVGKKVRAFSYPLNDYDLNVYEIVSKNFDCAFAGFKCPLDIPAKYQIPRTYIHHSNHHYLNLKFSGLHVKPIKL